MATPASFLQDFTAFTASLSQGQHVPAPIGSGDQISAALEAERQKVYQLTMKSQSLIGEADFKIKDLARDNAVLSNSLETVERKLVAAEETVETSATKLREAVEANLKETSDLKKEKTDLEAALLTAQNEAKEAKDKLELAEKAKTDLETVNAQLTTDLQEAQTRNNTQGAAALGLPAGQAAAAGAAATPGQAPVVAGATTEQGVQTPQTVQLTAEQIAQAALEAANPEAARVAQLRSTVGEFRRLEKVYNSLGGRRAKADLDAYRNANLEAIYAAQSLGF